MDELRRAMLDAGAPPDEWQAELPFLIEAGQKRVRRRRMIATGVAAALITAVGTTAVLAGVPGLNKSDPDPVKELPSGLYVEERISPAEVDRRCTIAVNNVKGTDKAWVAGVNEGERAVPAAESVRPVENRVGHVVEVATPGLTFRPGEAVGEQTPAEGEGADGSVTYCTIPQSQVLTTTGRPSEGALPSSADVREIADRCWRYGGYDVRGWDLLVAADFDVVEAIFLSKNGYLLTCTIGRQGVEIELDGERLADDDGRPILPRDDRGRRDPDRYSQLAVSCSEGRPAECSASGVLPGLPDGYQIELTGPDGSRQTTETSRGAYAIRIEVPNGLDGDRPKFKIRVLAPDGVVVWKGTTTPPGPNGASVGSDSYDPGEPPARP